MQNYEFDGTINRNNGYAAAAKARSGSALKRFWDFFKAAAFVVFLAVCVLVIGLVAIGCNDEPDKEKERADAISKLDTFLTSVREGKNFTTVHEYPDSDAYTFCVDVDKIQINDSSGVTTYAVNESGTLYKIYFTEDSWHKDVADAGTMDSGEHISTLMLKVDSTPWKEYDGKTKTLKCKLDDGSVTAKLGSDKVIITLVTENGTTVFTVKDVGTTVVTLPENVTDDTQKE